MNKYQFTAELLGDTKLGRPNLGTQVDVEIYRLMQFTFRDVMEAQYGTEAADQIFFAAGKIAGEFVFDHFIAPAETLDEFIRKTQNILNEKKIGIFRVESIRDDGTIILTVDEDLDCSGLPETDTEICVYDEGFLAGLLERFSGNPWTAKEIDCWCTGARTCRFEAREVTTNS